MIFPQPDPNDPTERLRRLKESWLRYELTSSTFCALWRALVEQRDTWRWN